MELPEALKKIDQLEAEKAKLVLALASDEALAKLKSEALKKGSEGVSAAFLLYGVVFLATILFEWCTKTGLKSQVLLLGLGALLCIALLVYFGFIFGYTIAAEVTARRLALEAQANAHPRQVQGDGATPSAR